MAKEKLLDTIAKKLSNQRYIERFHATSMENLPGILDDGLKPYRDGVSFTSAVYGKNGIKNGSYLGYPLLAGLKFRIPKDEYISLQTKNPIYEGQTVYKSSTGYPYHKDERMTRTVRDGGRVDTFNGTLKPEWIYEICFPYGNDVVCKETWRNGSPSEYMGYDKNGKMIWWNWDEDRPAEDWIDAGFRTYSPE